MSNKNAVTLTMIFEAQSANYGEGIGNISQLKKLTRGNGNVYTYISRQAIRYNVINQMKYDNTPVEDNGVVQFAASSTISDYPEIDLFGYMKTSSKKESGKGGQKVRSAVVRLSNAISLEPYNCDVDFLTNMGMAKRSGLSNAIAQSEIHKSMYAYTITIDLDKVGIDENDNIEIENSEKSKRICDLLETLEFLNRDIKGRCENLNPIFAIGGVYSRKNPYFESRIELKKGKLDTEMLTQIINSCEDTKENTVVGYLTGIFPNEEDIAKLSPVSVNEVFAKIKEGVKAYYA